MGIRRLSLVFDSGCGLTQVDTRLVENLGYSVVNAIGISTVQGPAGDATDGYIIVLSKMNLLGKIFENLPVAVYDFDNYSSHGIDGLLGWDVIRQLHFEMDGPRGELKIF